MKNYFSIFSLSFLALFLTQTESSAQWVNTNCSINYTVFAFTVSGTKLFSGMYHDGVFVTTDNGTSWAEANSGLTNKDVRSLAVSDTNLFAGTFGSGVFRSTNSGASWIAVNSGMDSTHVVALIADHANLFAGGEEGVFRSTNKGTDWTATNSGFPWPGVKCFVISDNSIYAGTTNGVFRSTNNGDNWIETDSGMTGRTTTQVLALVASDAYLFAGTYKKGIFRSSDNGISWDTINSGLTTLDVWSLAVSGNNLFVGTWFGGVFRSTNNGDSWTAVNSGLSGYNDLDVTALTVFGADLYAGSSNAVWRRPMSEITSIEYPSAQLPGRFALNQNYPNPFNPSTTISFTISSKSFVSLKVFDVMGREVATMVSQGLPAGHYTKQWNASGLPSGIYFYRLQAGSFTETIKLVLLK
jgi:photosystem II stability/assembly factor-like uncharacterized protein